MGHSVLPRLVTLNQGFGSGWGFTRIRIRLTRKAGSDLRDKKPDPDPNKLLPNKTKLFSFDIKVDIIDILTLVLMGGKKTPSFDGVGVESIHTIFTCEAIEK